MEGKCLFVYGRRMAGWVWKEDGWLGIEGDESRCSEQYGSWTEWFISIEYNRSVCKEKTNSQKTIHKSSVAVGRFIILYNAEP